jgi:hypothetical protein
VADLVSDTVTNERRVIVRLTWKDILDALSFKAATFAGISLHPGASVKIEMDQLTEGSPAYNIPKWNATLTFIEDRSPKATNG